jgi:uridine monophosphate synthetase
MNTQSSKHEFAKQLFNIGAVKFGEFTLKSGKKSPFYIDLRVLSSYPEVLKQAGKLLGAIIVSSHNKPDVLCGIPSAGLAIANAISFQYDIPVIYTKKEPIIYKELANHLRQIEKESGVIEKQGLQKAIDAIDALSGMKTHGLARYVDGNLGNGMKVGIVDDLITTAESKLESMELIMLEAQKRNIVAEVVGVYVLLDREQGGKEALREKGLDLYSILTIRETAKLLLEHNLLTDKMHDIIVEYTLAERRNAGIER